MAERSTRAYAARASEYADLLGHMDAVADQDRVQVEDWARSVTGPLADVGCGPGHWTAHLTALGHDVVGVEPVSDFVAHARLAHPEAEVREGSFETLPAAAYAGILAWYSTIHTPPDEMPALLVHLRRALRQNGALLLGFFAGDRLAPFDHAITKAWVWPVDELVSRLEAVGFTVQGCGTRKDPDARRHGWITAART